MSILLEVLIESMDPSLAFVFLDLDGEAVGFIIGWDINI